MDDYYSSMILDSNENQRTAAVEQAAAAEAAAATKKQEATKTNDSEGKKAAGETKPFALSTEKEAGRSVTTASATTARAKDATRMDTDATLGQAGPVASLAQQQHHVSHARYPVPDPLRRRLEAAILKQSENAKVDIVRETSEQALELLLSNAIQAIDAMYFATQARVRKLEVFSHRLCLRIRADPQQKTLSLTDLGAGMTRADLINALGIGRPIVDPRTKQKKKTNAATASATAASETSTDSTDEEEFDEYEYEDDDDEYEYDEDNANSQEEDQGEEVDEAEDDDDDNAGGDDDEEDQEMEEEEEQQQDNDVVEPAPISPVSCLASDMGGFYAALCALGTGVRVGTKSKFDEYYEFELGILSDHDEVAATAAGTSTNGSDATNGNNSTNAETPKGPFHEFSIRRPREEGTELSVENGFDQFQHVRSDSGTCVTIRLNDRSISEGLLDESKLKAIFLKLVETTQYTVAFSTDPEAPAIIRASALEKEAVAALKRQEEEAMDVVATDLEQLNTNRDHTTVMERAKYIPLRLSLSERKMLRLVEATMNCCDYTTTVDRPFKSEARRMHEQLKGITSVLKGLVTACDYAAGQRLHTQDENFIEYEESFRRLFEIARRHKIMNPEKMRTEYGKLIYLLQDAVSPTLQPHLGFSVKGPIESVYKFLQDRDGLDLLADRMIETATEEILAGKKSRAKIDNEIRAKERAVNTLKKKYRTAKLSTDDIHLCLYSICDQNSFLNANRVPLDKVIDYLTQHFSPDSIQEGYSLAIVSGRDGARLSHSHERQFYYALQSLTLWRDIIDDMFRLWAMAEEDLLSESVSYALQDTGQGMQRVQQSPRTYKAMQQILIRVQNKVRHWVGSSVIHLGDHNVPNALSFIDKYTQVPRILGPIVSCIENVEKIYEKDKGVKKMIDMGFGGLDKLKQDILYDFFRSAFDGSGAETYYDAGSCIDGRLTSAWHWCSQLPEKPFFPIFKLARFIGFDGEFK